MRNDISSPYNKEKKVLAKCPKCGVKHMSTAKYVFCKQHEALRYRAEDALETGGYPCNIRLKGRPAHGE